MDLAVEKLLKRDRALTLAGAAAIAAAAWAYVAGLAAQMNGMSGMSGMMDMKPWGAAEAWVAFVMWAAMMVAMMVPSATPVILLYARAYRHQEPETRAVAPTGAFLLGYIVVWIAFSAVMTTLQWALEQTMLLSSMMTATSPVFGAVVLIAAGVYQWLPTKNTCLRHCRSPVEFLSTHWRSGGSGAFRMGLEHGIYCLGCCWMLMLLLFVGGVMNLVWVGAIAVFVLLEKIAPFGRAAGRIGSILLAGWGVVVLYAGVVNR